MVQVEKRVRVVKVVKVVKVVVVVKVVKAVLLVKVRKADQAVGLVSVSRFAESLLAVGWVL